MSESTKKAETKPAPKKGEESLTGLPKKVILRRLFAYILKYRGRISAGVALSLLASFMNLFSLAGFVPIFNALGESGPVTVFAMGGEEKQRLGKYERGEPLPVYQTITASISSFKQGANDRLKDKTSNEAILILCGILLPIYLLKVFCVIGTLYFIGTAGLMAVRDVRMELYEKMNELGIEFFTEKRSGYIMSRIINDVELVGKSLSVDFNDALINVFYIITHFAFLALISWEMLLITVFIVPILMYPVSEFATHIRRAARGQQDRLADMGSHVQEILSGIRVIRAFSMERFERNRFKAINEDLYANTFRGHYFHQVGPAITEFVSTLVVVGFLVWGANAMAGKYLLSAKPLTKGDFFAFFFTLIFIMRPLKQVSIMINLLSNAAVAGDRIFDITDREPSVADRPGAKPFSTLQNEIAYKNVTFKYPGADGDSLQNIDFTIKKGQTISLVGSSGAGKSTLVDLLPRFYDVTEGSIKIDGVDVRDLKYKDLRTGIGIVTQSIFLFNATIRENIAYGRSDIPLERVIETAKAANAHEFISEMPEGYETPIGERGVMLSGGQRQRIAIARALLRDPPILIFDEATSALDNESERLVQEAMERLLEGRTVFIIAHRLSTVYRSDEIFVMEQGAIAERGTHDYLLENGTIYKKLYDMQFAD